MIEHNFQDGILEICINRPEKKNALSTAMYLELQSLFQKYGNLDACSSIILYGAGSCFTAGADLKDFQTKRDSGDSPGVKFLRALSQSSVPVIAAVEGVAVGIGATLLQHCDFVYASAETRFRLPFVALGLSPEGGSTYLLEHVVGRRKARDWLITGRFFDGQEACQAGLVTEIIAANGTLDKARATAQLIRQLPSSSVRTTKRMLDEWTQTKIQTAFDNEVRMFATQLASSDTQGSILATGKINAA